MQYYLNPGVTFTKLDANSARPMVICHIPVENGGITRFVLPCQIKALLEMCDGAHDTDTVIGNYLQHFPGQYSQAKLQQLVTHFLVPCRLLVSKNGPCTLEPRKTRFSYLYLRFPILPAAAVAGITRGLSWLFYAPIVVGWTVFFAAASVWFYFSGLSHYHFNLNELDGYNIIWVLFGSSISAFIHEFGHASALSHYGGRNGEIGWGLYLSFPVFYTDVTDAWKLSRKQRAMVDMAGIYFQSTSALALMLAFRQTRQPFLLYCLTFVVLQMAGSLNPFLRADGYWLVADLFGIVNLRRQSLSWWKNRLRRAAGLQKRLGNTEFELSRRASIVLVVYTLFGSLFFCYLCYVMAVQFIWYLLPNYPLLYLKLWHVLQAHPISVLKIAGALMEILWKSVALYGFLTFVCRGVARAWSARSRVVQTMRGAVGTPDARSAVSG